MMKYMLVLVVLLHLCSNVMSNTSCYRGIITDLSKLNKLYKEKQVTINSKQMLVPSEEMHRNACSCLGVFAQKVKQVLSNNVTANNKSRHIIHQIKASLSDLEKHPTKINQTCEMVETGISLKPFQFYINFLRELTKGGGCHVTCVSH